ncbi:VanZ family protein [Paenibacillus eucommiae]|uniref:VanZ family protein n=1 Tax=Paenibacillus eucommiae TaxID=1355755 RepID=A0ABS4IP86_9BACL|nr:VanZ family protein [Paenibacillus eucommiae]MBP1989323.1 VanZ family protein [Paenibacillus eucommiae]
MTRYSSRRFYLLLGAAILWMAVIFYKSAESYQEQSLLPFFADWISDPDLSSWLSPLEFTYDGGLVSWRDPYGMLEFFIRKGGHVVGYAILSLLLGYAFLARPIKSSTAILLSSLISVLYAASDEWHQSFVEGRTGHAIDVGVDSIGVLLVLIWLFYSEYRKRKRNRYSYSYR